ncbi:MAG: tRNA (adenosine(37)-N6)-dimethylallyltransferase MiaA [Candidatus Paceibacterota bacterium]|jgi:tRNA dimethylallyltransferase
MKKSLPKIIAIVGPTASGKSDLAVSVAKEFNGEVISADSRQVYKGLDIGTGKISKKEMKGVPHHLLDVVSPKKKFTVTDFKELADKAIKEILSRGKLPIICGGTGFYIDAVVQNILLPEVPPNKKLRKKLEAMNPEKLYVLLQKLDPRRAKEIDKKNLVRVMRAIEIAKALGKVPKAKSNPLYKTLTIGTKWEESELQKRIGIRLQRRMKTGMISEAKKLHESGLSWKRMQELGLEYRYLALYLQGKMSKSEMTEKLETEIRQYAKRQMTWFKKNQKIIWIEPNKLKEIEEKVRKFL